MEFLLLSRRRFSARNVPSGEERGETDVFAGYDILGFFKLKTQEIPRVFLLAVKKTI